MSKFYDQLKEREAYLTSLKRDLEEEAKKFPEGNLRISKSRGKPRYYVVKEKYDTHGKYIPKKEIELANILAKKDYTNKLLKAITEEYSHLKKYRAAYEQNKLEDIYDHLNEYRKAIVNPIIKSDEMYKDEWEKSIYETNQYHPEEKVYETKRGELVRSKSEVMLADMYYELGIPYRYEAKLQLRNGKYKYPDFTLLKVAERETIYHEHMGLMDDDEYRKLNLIKLEEYRSSGIYFGKNLIVTFESEGVYLNIKEIRNMVKEIFGIRN